MNHTLYSEVHPKSPTSLPNDLNETRVRNPNLLYPINNVWDESSESLDLEYSFKSNISKASKHDGEESRLVNPVLAVPRLWKHLQRSNPERSDMNNTKQFHSPKRLNADNEETVNLTRYGSVNETIRIIPRIRVNSETPDINHNDEQPAVERMRTKLQFFYMNPLEKWQVTQQFPYKFAIQLIKIIFVTVQLYLFATYRYANVDYILDTKLSFHHLFLMEWDYSDELVTPRLPVFTKDQFYSFMDFAVKSYDEVETQAVGPYYYTRRNGTRSPIQLCIEKYADLAIFKFKESYVWNTEVETKCVPIEKTGNFSSQRFFESEENSSISFDSLLEAHLVFSLKTVRLRSLKPLDSPHCYKFDIDVSFNNRDRDGQILVALDATPIRLVCKGDMECIEDNEIQRIGHYGVNYIVIGLCTLSLVLCSRAIYRAQILKSEVILFFKKNYRRELSIHERLDFLNFWYLLIISNDVLIIAGSTLKEEIEKKELTGEIWNVCSVLLGVGNLFVWFGVLRYLGFFKTYNILILTLRKATPNILRFLLCAILIFAGFTFCGWLVLGPYHAKFSNLYTTSECLFSLINGDDMFNTFDSMSAKSSLLWWFSRLYLYTFITLFIHVVLSLFIALIMDAYETIKMCYMDGFPRSTLEEFVGGADITILVASQDSDRENNQFHILNSFSSSLSNTSGKYRRPSYATTDW